MPSAVPNPSAGMGSKQLHVWLVVLHWLLREPLLVLGAPRRGQTYAFDVSPAGRIIRVEEPVVPRGSVALHEPAKKLGRASRAYDVAAVLGAGGDDRGNPSCGEPYPAVQIPSEHGCPAECPFLAESLRQNKTCEFACVKEEDCGSKAAAVDDLAHIAEGNGGYCRRCTLLGCEACELHKSSCAKCSANYTLVGGRCRSNYLWARYAATAGLSLVVVLAFVWYLQLRCRPAVNMTGLDEGLRFRSRTKLRMPRRLGQVAAPSAAAGAAPSGAASDTGGSAPGSAEVASGDGGDDPGTRPLWPLTTNLLRTPAGGPGLTLLFNFQLAVIVWAVGIAGMWAIYAAGTHPSLFVLGLHPTKTPRDLCEVVIHGHEVQASTMASKVVFLALVYVATFVGAVGFAMYQRRSFEALDERTTMKDFAALCGGLPRLQGSESVEDKLSDIFRRETNQRVVGVSVCWDCGGKIEAVRQALEAELAGEPGPAAWSSPGATGSQGVGQEPPWPPTHRSPLRKLDAALLAACGVKGAGHAPGEAATIDSAAVGRDERKRKAEALVRGMESTSYAFVVFESESARDSAVALVKEMGGVNHEGSVLRLSVLDAEPDTVIWESFGIARRSIPMRLACGVAAIVVCLALWVLCFYLPYVAYVASFSYTSGEEPQGAPNLIITMVIVGGNFVMYQVSALVSTRVGFLVEDDREAAYMILYSMAVFLNVSLDTCITIWMSYQKMVVAGAHTYGGKRLADLSSAEDIFESYPTQRTAGWQLLLYGFPSCFLLPFILEALFALYVPYHLFYHIVRSTPGISGRSAERALAISAPMDMARYADVLVNVSIAVLIFFFPSGFVLPMFLALGLSHVYMYTYDHYRVLRCVPGFCYAGDSVDRKAQKLLAIPCGILLSCIAFKANCAVRGMPCLHGAGLLLLLVGAFVLHVALHWALLYALVPRLAGSRWKNAQSPCSYEETARENACTWFSANPVHCLRSSVIYKHNPPCSYFVRGREHLMKANPKIGAFFSDKAAVAEDYIGGPIQNEVPPEVNFAGADVQGGPIQNEVPPEVNFAGADVQGGPIQDEVPPEVTFAGADVEGSPPGPKFTGTSEPAPTARPGAASPPRDAEARRDAKQKAARMLKSGIRSGEVEKILDEGKRGQGPDQQQAAAASSQPPAPQAEEADELFEF